MAWSWGVKTDRLAGFDHYVTQIHNGDWIKVREVDFGDASPVEIEMKTLNFRTAGVVEFYIDSLGGDPFAAFDVQAEGAMKTAVKRPVTGRHDVYILFRGGDEQFFDFDWWQVK